MRPVAVAMLSTLALAGGGAVTPAAPQSLRQQQVVLTVERQSPGIDLRSFTLISDHPDSDRGAADAIMRVKTDWPRAMQTKDEALFRRILSPQFIFREADGTLYERDAYIRNRVESRERVVAVRYENVVLQLFGRLALLTYQNILDHTDASGKPDTLHLSWADVFAEEDGGWKIRASHLISERIEPR
jgi:ketosteroid isomerase-like protein